MKRRLQKIVVTRELLIHLLRGRCPLDARGMLRWHTTELPADLEVIRAEWKDHCDAVVLICQSAAFPEIEPGSFDVPYMVVEQSMRQGPVDQVLADLQRIEREAAV